MLLHATVIFLSGQTLTDLFCKTFDIFLVEDISSDKRSVLFPRYLCDYTYYTSLFLSEGRSAFVHVPPLGKPYSAEQLARALRAVILEMLELMEHNKGKKHCLHNQWERRPGLVRSYVAWLWIQEFMHIRRHQCLMCYILGSISWFEMQLVC